MTDEASLACVMESRKETEASAVCRGPAQPRVVLCGVAMDALTMGDAVAAVERSIDQRRPLMIGVVNAAKLVNMRKDVLLRASVTSSDLVLADGAPLVWLSRLRRTPLPERVAGIDLMLELFALADKRKFRVYLLGATKSVLERVVAFAAGKYPNMAVVGSQDGYFAESQDEQVANAVRDSNADMLFVAMSSPRKEIFMNRWNSRMAVPVCHGVGGSFDVVAGVTKRAPRWMQRVGLEWLYRVMQEPGRMWKRYLVTNTLFVGLAIRELLGIGSRQKPGRASVDSVNGVTK